MDHIDDDVSDDASSKRKSPEKSPVPPTVPPSDISPTPQIRKEDSIKEEEVDDDDDDDENDFSDLPAPHAAAASGDVERLKKLLEV
jgi:hypothetical protein